MISALYRYKKNERRAVAQRWAKRSNAGQDAARRARPIDADTLRRRAQDDARGEIVRQGVTFTAGGEIAWHVRRAVAGRVNQFEIVAAGKIWRTGGSRAVRRWLSRRR